MRGWLLPLRVQRLRSPETGLRSFTVVDGCGLPVWPVEEFLAHLVAGGKAPNTVEAYARDLRDLFEGATSTLPNVRHNCSISDILLNDGLSLSHCGL